MLSSFALCSCNHRGSHPSLEDSVQAMLDPSKFNVTMLDENAVVLVVAENGSPKFLTPAQVSDFFAKAKTAGFKTSGFNVLQKEDSGQFASIAYRVSWTIPANNSTNTVHVLSHEIWVHETHGWRRVFATIEPEH
jgi:hypothetical protein